MSQDTYHHGNLQQALMQTGVELLRSSGPAGLTAREATREQGVSVAALYRHFDDVDQWRAEVARCAREELARRMLTARDAAKPSRSAKTQAIRRFRAVGEGYIQFAVDEPNLFAGAFMKANAAPRTVEEPSAWSVLEAALDELLAAGVLSPKMRADAPLIAWTAVHGLASLIAQGAVPIGDAQDPQAQAILDGVTRALEFSA